MTQQETSYAARMDRHRAYLAELTEALYGRRDLSLKGWGLREEIHVTLEKLPKRERAAWLAEHDARLQVEVGRHNDRRAE